MSLQARGLVGNYIADNFGIGDLIVPNLTMAVATSARYVELGSWGSDLTQMNRCYQAPTHIPTLLTIWWLKIQSIHGRTACGWMISVGLAFCHAPNHNSYLSCPDKSVGTVLFGGYDTNKYTGEIMALEIQPDANSGKADTMTVAWTSLSITNPDGSKLLISANFTSPTVLDSGTSYTALPASMFDDVANWFGVINDADYGYPSTLDYGFGGSKGPVISVKYAEVAIPIYS
jgi:Eukaryotic aspartyl protease